MNKRELAKAVAVQANVHLKTVSAVLDGFTDVVTAVVAQGQPVAITGFAKFVKVDRPARMGRNPATGAAIKIKASKKARITAVKAFKDAVMSPSTAPKLVRGAFPTNEDAVRRAGVAAAAAPAKKAAAPKRKPVAKPKAVAKKAAAKRTTTKAAPRRKPAARAKARR